MKNRTPSLVAWCSVAFVGGTAFGIMCYSLTIWRIPREENALRHLAKLLTESSFNNTFIGSTQLNGNDGTELLYELSDGDELMKVAADAMFPATLESVPDGLYNREHFLIMTKATRKVYIRFWIVDSSVLCEMDGYVFKPQDSDRLSSVLDRIREVNNSSAPLGD